MVCKKCGYQNSMDAVFCSGCGNRLKFEDQPPVKKSSHIGLILIFVAVFLVVGYLVINKESVTCHSWDHQWVSATCTKPQTCKICNATVGTPKEHSWQDASCTLPQSCSVCGATTGSAAGHVWVEATNTSPKTCVVCRATEGSVITNDATYINEIIALGGRNALVWTRSTDPVNYGFEFTNEDAPECWSYMDIYVGGHTPGVVIDNYGNEYTYGIHVDGADSEEYYFSIDLYGEYTTFAGTVGCPEKSKAISEYVYNQSTAYTKYFEVYGDGVLLYTSPTMRYDYPPQEFSVDVTGVTRLTIVYPATAGPNEIATIYDGRVS